MLNIPGTVGVFFIVKTIVLLYFPVVLSQTIVVIQSQLAQDHCPAPIRVFEAGVLFFVWCLFLRPLGAFLPIKDI